MPGKLMKIGSFSDWEGLFKEWRQEIGVNHDDIRNFKFDTLYGAIETDEITFGYYKGRNKWENVRQIPTQNMRDAGPLDELHVARRGLPHGHGKHRAGAHCRSGRGSRLAHAEVSQQMDLQRL